MQGKTRPVRISARALLGDCTLREAALVISILRQMVPRKYRSTARLIIESDDDAFVEYHRPKTRAEIDTENRVILESRAILAKNNVTLKPEGEMSAQELSDLREARDRVLQERYQHQILFP